MIPGSRFLAILLLAGSECTAWADTPAPAADVPHLRQSPYVRTLRIAEPAGKDRWGKIVLDPLLYACTTDLQNDLQLTGPDGAALPFVIGKETVRGTRRKEGFAAGKITGITPLPDGRTSIEYTLNEPSEVCGIEFQRDNRPFRCTLSVDVSDHDRWIVAFAGHTITDAPGFPEPVRRLLLFSRSYRTGKLRILVGKNTYAAPAAGRTPAAVQTGNGVLDATPMELEAIRAVTMESYVQPEMPVTEEYALTLLRRTLLADREILLLGSRREPLTAIRVAYPEPCYQRRVEIAGSDDGKGWIPLTGGTLRKLDSEQSDRIEFPVSRYRRYRLTITPEDHSRPSAPPTVTAAGVRYFLAVPAPLPSVLNLYYGGRMPTAASGDVAAPQPFMKRQEPVLFLLQESGPNPLAAGTPAAARPVRWMLPLILLLALLILLLALPHKLRRTAERFPDDPE